MDTGVDGDADPGFPGSMSGLAFLSPIAGSRDDAADTRPPGGAVPRTGPGRSPRSPNIRSGRIVPPGRPPDGAAGGGADEQQEPLGPGERITIEPGSLADASRPEVLSLEELAGATAPAADPDRYFLPKEKHTADWLRDIGGHTIRSIDRIADSKAPDSALHDGSCWRTAEIKTLRSDKAAAIIQNVRRARKQARTIILDGEPVGLSRKEAVDGLRDAVRNYGRDLDHIVIRLGDGAALVWLP